MEIEPIHVTVSEGLPFCYLLGVVRYITSHRRNRMGYDQQCDMICFARMDYTLEMSHVFFFGYFLSSDRLNSGSIDIFGSETTTGFILGILHNQSELLYSMIFPCY
jgi:hypothetical protein